MRRRRRRHAGPAAARAGASSACASGSAASAARSRPGRRRRAASRVSGAAAAGSGALSLVRRRPVPRPQRLPHDRSTRAADLEVVGEAADGARGGELARASSTRTSSSWTCACPSSTASRRPARSSVGTRARILVLTTFDLDEYVYEALRAGASGFLLKDVEPAELVEAIRVVAAGDAPSRPVGDPPAARPVRALPSPDAGPPRSTSSPSARWRCCG